MFLIYFAGEYMRAQYFLLLFLIITLSHCKKHADPPALSASNEIISFSFRVVNNSPALKEDINGTIRNDSIIIKVPLHTPVTSLVPDIGISGKSISPAAAKAQDFTSPIRYTVIAENGSSRTYTAVVSFLDSSKEIVSFVFGSAGNPALTTAITVAMNADSVSVLVPSELTSFQLVPTIVYKGKSLSPASGVAQDFSSPVTYTVTAEDGSSRQYTIIAGKNAFLYVGSSNGFLYALDPSLGRIKWKLDCGAPLGSPVYSNGTIYVSASDAYNGYMMAVDAATGTKKWQTSLIAGTYSNPVAQDGLVAVACGSSNTYHYSYLFTIDQVSGKLLWQVGPNNAGYANPSIGKGIVAVTSFNYGLLAYHATDGSTAWSLYFGITGGNPIIINNTIYFGGEGSLITACDVSTGAIKWATVPGDIGINAATAAEGLIFSPNYNFLCATNITDGTKAWRVDLGAALAPPSYTNGLVVAFAGGHYLGGFQAATGKSIWSKTYTNTQQSTSLTGANGWIYFGTSDGTLQALDASTGITRWIFRQNGASFSNSAVLDSKGNAYHVADSGNQQ